MKKVFSFSLVSLFVIVSFLYPLTNQSLAKEGLGGININTGCGNAQIQVLDANGRKVHEGLSDEKGFYSTGLVLEPGKYKVIPLKQDCIFTPPDREVTIYEGQYSTIGFQCDCKEIIDLVPRIIKGPSATKITQTSALIIWETDQDCDSSVFFDRSAKSFSKKESNPTLTKNHEVELSKLTMGTTYEYKVMSQTKSGKSVSSKSAFFTTLPEEDNEKPSISFTLPNTLSGKHKIIPILRDNKGVKRVELLVDQKIIATSFSAPFEFEFLTPRFGDGKHVFEMRAFDQKGNMGMYVLEGMVSNAVPLITTVPEVEIRSPDNNTEFDKNTRTINVRGIIRHPYKRDIKRVIVYIDKVQVSTTRTKIWANANDLPKDFSFTLSIEDLTPGTHELMISAVDEINLTGSGITHFISNLPPWKRPSISISYSESTIPYTGTYIIMNVYVINNGTYPAKNLSIEITQDFLPGFIMTDFSVPADISIVSDKQVATVNKSELKNISGGGTRWDFTYKMVPVLSENLNWNDYDMMSGLRYKYSWEGKESRSSWNTLDITRDASSTTDWCSGNADYLLVTSYNRLKSNFPTKLVEINTLLLSMADLAILKRGVIGNLSSSVTANSTKTRIQSTWGNQLVGNWSSAGYLLLVGETEIVPSFMRTYWWTDDDGVYRGHDCYNQDFPYANTCGTEIKPEISIGRIIGDTVEALNLPIKASIDVKKGTAFFYRNNHANSDAYLISGTGDGEDQFWSSTQNNAGVIDNEIHNVSYDRGKTLVTNNGDMGPYNAIKNKANGLDILVYRDHAGSSCWCDGVVVARSDPASSKKVAGFNFGTTRPFVFSVACDAGKYEGIYGMANAFMEKAGAYLGATEGSGRSANNTYSKKFFEKWINHTSKSLGLAWKELRNDCTDDFWSAEYQFYGDPKFGSIP